MLIHMAMENSVHDILDHTGRLDVLKIRSNERWDWKGHDAVQPLDSYVIRSRLFSPALLAPPSFFRTVYTRNLR